MLDHVPNIMLVLHVEILTFQILILLAHCPHTDLVVDHIDTRKAAETGLNISITSIVKDL